MITAPAALWVFGYGSLMWRPGFAHTAAVPATIVGYRRCFCIYSVHHRGTAARPGLVLGLDRGGVCHGLAFQVPSAAIAETLAYLRAREQVNGVYREVALPMRLAGRAAPVDGVAYLAERAHPSYAGRLAIARQARLIRAARGLSGTNLEYLGNTVAHLRSLGIRDREIEGVLTAAGALFVRGDDAGLRGVRSTSLVATLRHDRVLAKRLKPGDRRRFMHRLSAARTTAD